ncbi:hypothetical protein BH11CYA1_BH11CYA1_02590 [soil metagenome]
MILLLELRPTHTLNFTKRLVLALCTAAFLFAQFWSFAAAATLLESIDTDPCNDICLEDVISVDPFVGGSCGAFGSERADSTADVTLAGFGFVTPEQAVFSAMFLFALLADYKSLEMSLLSTVDGRLEQPKTVALREFIGKLQV